MKTKIILNNKQKQNIRDDIQSIYDNCHDNHDDDESSIMCFDAYIENIFDESCDRYENENCFSINDKNYDDYANAISKYVNILNRQLHDTLICDYIDIDKYRCNLNRQFKFV